MTIMSLAKNEYDSYYGRYLSKLPKDIHLIQGFESGRQRVSEFFSQIPPQKHLFSYEAGKWTIKEVLQHLIDSERIFIYRCFRIARRDTQPLANFNQELYVTPSGAKQKSMKALIVEFELERAHSIALLKSLSTEDLAFIGKVNHSAMSARAAAFIIIGHEIWHLDLIKERYL